MPGRPASSPRLLWPVVVGALLVVAAWVRLHALDVESLWLDETFSVALGRGQTRRLIAEVAQDVHPPFYFLLVSAWFHLLDGSAWTARLLSVVCSLGVIALTFALGRRWIGAPAAALAALILAVSPFQIEFAQEARMYALLALLATASTWACWSLGSSATPTADGAPRLAPLVTRAWLVYVVTSALMIYTHAAGLFVLAAHAAALASTTWPTISRRRVLERWLTALLAVTALFLPWLGTFVTQFSAVQEAFWVPAPTWRTLVDPLVAFAGSTWAAWLLCTLALLGMRGWRRVGPPGAADSLTMVVAWLAVPIAAPFALSLAGSSVFLPKYTIAASVPLALLAAAGVMALPRLPRLAVSALVGLLSASAVGSYFDGVPRKDDWRRAIGDIERDAAPGETIVFYPFFLEFPLEVYRTRSDVRVARFERHAAAATGPTLGVMLDRLTHDASGVWLVVMEYDSRRSLLADRLHGQFADVGGRRYGHVDVFRFGRRVTSGDVAVPAGLPASGFP